jgi:hypothetical protein
VSFYGSAPVYTPVSGHVTLDGGAGPVTAVSVVATGAVHAMAHPDLTGLYTMHEVQQGIRRFTATLDGYHTATRIDTVGPDSLPNRNLTLRRLDPPQVLNLVKRDPVTIGVDQGRDSLHWDLSPDPLVDVYRVYRRARGDQTWTVHHTVVGRAHNWDVDTVNSGFWQYHVTAVDNDVVAPPVESQASNRVEVGFGHLPPFGLEANGNFDNKIQLDWLDPMTPPSSEVFYDDGSAEQSIGYQWGTPTVGWYVAHFQGRDTITVTDLKFYFTNQAILGSSFQVGVFADSGNGYPTSEPLAVMDVTQEEPLDVFRTIPLDAPVAIPGGSFFIGARQTMSGTVGYLGLGADADTFITNTFYENVWGWNGWTTFESNSARYTPMLRAQVRGEIGGNVPMTLAPSPVIRRSAWPVTPIPVKKQSSSSLLASKSAFGQKSALTQKSASMAKKGPEKENWSEEISLQAPPEARRLNELYRQTHRTGIEPLIIPARSQSTHRPGNGSLDQVTKYMIYRDNALIDSVVQGTYTYVNRNTPENHAYSYFVKAKYDDFIESPASNTLTGVMCNMAPGAPSNLVGTPVGQSAMRLTWTDPVVNADGSPLTDLTTLRIYRDGVALPTGSVNPGVQTFLDNVPNPAQIYTWEVRAADEVPNISTAASLTGYVVPPYRSAPYDWVDISDLGQMTGCATPGGNDDGICGPFDLGFNFTYFGNTFSQVYVSANGWLTFSTSDTTSGPASYNNASIPSGSIPNCAIYPFWDDLSPQLLGATMMWYSDGQRFIVSWNNVPHYSSNTNVYTFQVILSQNGGVRFNYQSIAPLDSSCTVGVEDCEGQNAIQLYYNGAGEIRPATETSIEIWGGHAGSVQGTVMNFHGTRAVANCKVFAQDYPDTAFTDAAGGYILGVDPDNVYTIIFKHDTYCDTVQTDVSVVTGTPATVNIRMRAPAGDITENSVTLGPVWSGRDTQGTLHITNPGGECPLSYWISDTTSWLVESPTNGQVAPGETAQITLTAHTVGLPAFATLHSRIYVHYNSAGGTGTGEIIPVDLVLPTDPQGPALPTVFALYQNYPNPFNPTTLIRFDVPKESRVDLVIFNVMGQEVARPVGEVYQPGRYGVNFDASNLTSGMYLVRMNAGSFSSVSKMMLLK